MRTIYEANKCHIKQTGRPTLAQAYDVNKLKTSWLKTFCDVIKTWCYSLHVTYWLIFPVFWRLGTSLSRVRAWIWGLTRVLVRIRRRHVSYVGFWKKTILNVLINKNIKTQRHNICFCFNICSFKSVRWWWNIWLFFFNDITHSTRDIVWQCVSKSLNKGSIIVSFYFKLPFRSKLINFLNKICWGINLHILW